MPAKRLSRKTQFAVLGLAVAAIVLAFVAVPAALHVLGGARPADKPEEASAVQGNGQAFKVTDKQWATLKIQPVEEHVFQDASETDGKIATDEDLVTPVFSPYTGQVTRLIAKAGDSVRKGDPLFEIRATELAQAQNDLITAVAGLKTAKAQLNLATTNEKRQHELYSAQGAALKDWQQAQVDLATAQGGLSTAAITLSSVRSRLRILGKADQYIDQVENTPDILHLDAATMVNAPIDGTVVQRQIGLGQNIVSTSNGGGSSNPVFMIGDLSKVWLIANAREETTPFLHIGDKVEVHVLAFPSRVFHAKVTYVAASIDPSTHRLSVRAEVDNRTGDLKPEMFAGFRILIGEDGVAPGVPESAVVYEGENAHVWVGNAGAKTLEIRPVKTGRNRQGIVEMLDGLKAGEMIVTSGAVFIDQAASGS